MTSTDLKMVDMVRIPSTYWHKKKEANLNAPRIKSMKLFGDVLLYMISHEIQIQTDGQVYSCNFTCDNHLVWEIKAFPVYMGPRMYIYSLGVSLEKSQGCPSVETIVELASHSDVYYARFEPTDIFGIPDIGASLNCFYHGAYTMTVMMKVSLAVYSRHLSDVKDDVKEIIIPSDETNDKCDLLFGKNGDVILYGDEWECLVHKTILSSKSSVFKAMFNNDMEENRAKRVKKISVKKISVKITDIDGLIVKYMLIYMYTGEPIGLDKFHDELFIAANKYDVKDLKAACVNRMMKSITVGNVVKYLTYCDLINSDDFSARVNQFMISNFKNVIETDEWQQFKKSNKTMSELMEFKFQ